MPLSHSRKAQGILLLLLLTRADRALYRAKHSRRDCVCAEIYEPSA